MTSAIDTENSPLDLKDYDKSESFCEYDYEDQEKVEFKHDDDDIQSRQLWQKCDKSLLDDEIVIIQTEKHETEEEEKLFDLKDQNFSMIKYDLTRFGYEALSANERQDIIAKLKELNMEIRVLTVKNKFLHRNYINAIRNSASFPTALDSFDENVIFEDDRYHVALENFIQTKDAVSDGRAFLTTEMQSLEKSHSESESRFKSTFENLQSAELTVAKRIRPCKMDKQTWLSEVEKLLENQSNRVADTTKTRLAYLRLHSQLQKLRAKVSEFDNLGPGFSMFDYEALLKRQDVCLEKRDEQRGNLKKLSRMNLSCAATVRHIDEESDIYNEKLKEKLDELKVVSDKNKIEYLKYVGLVKTRATAFKDILRLREEIGLLDNPYLLRKMETDMNKITKLKKRSRSIESKMYNDQLRSSLLS